jgi:hypothetical protein
MMSKEGLVEPQSYTILERDLCTRRNTLEVSLAFSITTKQNFTRLSNQLETQQAQNIQTPWNLTKIKVLEAEVEKERVELISVDKANSSISQGIAKVSGFIRRLKEKYLTVTHEAVYYILL